jgi:hypothetical protein
VQVVTSLGDPEKAMNKWVAAVLLHDPNAMNYSFSVFTSHRLLSRIDQTVGRVSEAVHSVEPLILVLLRSMFRATSGLEQEITPTTVSTHPTGHGVNDVQPCEHGVAAGWCNCN